MREITKVILRMEGINKKFPGVWALKNVDFELREGEVHGLLGENGAGKSTLIKVLTGVYQKDSGKVFLYGKEVNINSPKEAMDLGIATIYQELSLEPYMNVAENIFLGREIRKGKFLRIIDWKKTHEEAKRILNDLGIAIDTRVIIRDLGIGKQQMVEIAKALSKNAKIIVMDEPTSSLSEREVEELFEVIKRLKKNGISFIYISHKLDEIFQICDRVTVMRDGENVVTLDVKNTNKDELIRYMVGRTLDQYFPKIVVEDGKKEALRVENLTRKGFFENVSFKTYTSEVLGIAGLVGAGRTEIVRAIFGADPIDYGKIYIFGEEVQIRSPEDAIKHGIVLLPEDRKRHGLILIHSVLDNVALPSLSLEKYKKGSLLNYRVIHDEVSGLIRKLDIKTPSPYKIVGELSGGNQQKVVIAKWLMRFARIFVFDEPTRGIDVGAKVEIYNFINELVKNNACVIMVSSELPEILGMSDRILVIHKGRVTGEFRRGEADQEKIIRAATGNL